MYSIACIQTFSKFIQFFTNQFFRSFFLFSYFFILEVSEQGHCCGDGTKGDGGCVDSRGTREDDINWEGFLVGPSVVDHDLGLTTLESDSIIDFSVVVFDTKGLESVVVEYNTGNSVRGVNFNSASSSPRQVLSESSVGLELLCGGDELWALNIDWLAQIDFVVAATLPAILTWARNVVPGIFKASIWLFAVGVCEQKTGLAIFGCTMETSLRLSLSIGCQSGNSSKLFH